MRRLLLDEPPLVVSPTLARVLGVNAAITLQQLHYWLEQSPHHFDGRPWIYNSYEAWAEQLPFSARTIKRIFAGLRGDEIVLVRQVRADRGDLTNWYSIDYERLEGMGPSWPDGCDKVARSTNTETTQRGRSANRGKQSIDDKLIGD